MEKDLKGAVRRENLLNDYIYIGKNDDDILRIKLILEGFGFAYEVREKTNRFFVASDGVFYFSYYDGTEKEAIINAVELLKKGEVLDEKPIMKEFAKTKIWIGGDQYLFTIVNAALEQRGVELGKVANRDVAPNSIYVKECGQGSFNCDETLSSFDNDPYSKITLEHLKIIPSSEKKEFKKGDYIVCLKDCHGLRFRVNYIFKCSKRFNYFHTVKDCNGELNGYGALSFDKLDNWRWASEQEKRMYEDAGKPVDVTSYSVTNLCSEIPLVDFSSGWVSMSSGHLKYINVNPNVFNEKEDNLTKLVNRKKKTRVKLNLTNKTIKKHEL